MKTIFTKVQIHLSNKILHDLLHLINIVQNLPPTPQKCNFGAFHGIEIILSNLL